ncbi:alpha/beta fold hydrolase [Pantoea vagans]|uniref:alpha/beta fold hydrolase n=1 Tax=Pantoea vagans TaxID=470934 RepID=UPI0028ED80C0|nr:alpha/beta fold hydrolase [Pantoea vagans]
MPFAQSFDGTELWYDIRKGGSGEPVLLIAGNGCDHQVWSYVSDDFTPDRPVIIYDHRGTGRSGDNFNERWSTRDFARDAYAILRHADLKRAHVYGHSMGGRVAQWLAADHPEMTGALVLGASSVGDRMGIPRLAETTSAMETNNVVALQAMCYPEDWVKKHPEQAACGAPNPHSIDAFLCHMRASGEHDSWDIAASILSPALVIHGSEDGMTLPANSEILAARIPLAELMMIEKARHVYWAGHPEVHKAVAAFLRKSEKLINAISDRDIICNQ